jgi:hypothetical protein
MEAFVCGSKGMPIESEADAGQWASLSFVLGERSDWAFLAYRGIPSL